jgi:TetR/AcrR family transcriptional regulator
LEAAFASKVRERGAEATRRESVNMGTESTRCRDPEGTRRAVLDAAERLFAERGFAGTSVRDLAAASGVSHPLIQHHFGTKEELYAAVLRRCAEEYAARFPDVVGVTDRPVDLRTEMTRIFTCLRQNGPLLRMIGWARLEGRQELVTGGEELRQALILRVEASQRLGLVRDDIDANILVTMMEALLFYWVENRERVDKCPSDESDDAYLEMAVALLERGFAPGPPRGRKARSPVKSSRSISD